MANHQMLREASWSESQSTPTNSSSSSGYSSEDSGDLEPDYVIPRQGPVIEIVDDFINMQRDYWRNCLIGVLVDDNTVKAPRLQQIIHRVRQLQFPVRVVGRSRNVYVFEFGCNLDREVIAHEGPWAIQNKYLVMQHWKPNLILENISLEAVPAWVEFWGFPLEYYSASVADLVGSMVGKVLEVDFSDQGFRNLRYLCVRVELDRNTPLLMGFYVLLDNGRTLWIQCKYERVFRICKQCGCLGHIARDCKTGRRRAQAAVEAQKQALRQRFNAVDFIDFNTPLFVNEAIAFRKFKGRRTTKISVQVDNEAVIYNTHEFRPISFLRTNSSSSSGASGTNVIRVLDDSSSNSDNSSSPNSSHHANPEVSSDVYVDIEEEDPLTPEGYYSASYEHNFGGQQSAEEPIPHPNVSQSPINWDLIACESSYWQPTSEVQTILQPDSSEQRGPPVHVMQQSAPLVTQSILLQDQNVLQVAENMHQAEQVASSLNEVANVCETQPQNSAFTEFFPKESHCHVSSNLWKIWTDKDKRKALEHYLQNFKRQKTEGFFHKTLGRKAEDDSALKPSPKRICLQSSEEGHKGGTVLAWKNSVKCSVLDISPNWIHTLATDAMGTSFNLTCVYGPPHLAERPRFWDKLSHIASSVQYPWLIIGDFNQVLRSSEKLSMNLNIPGAEDFENFLNDAGLINLHPQGNWFTWTNGRGFLLKDLNRTLITLIPKIDVPEKLKDFRPIGLCNVVYKVITKILVLRLQNIMTRIISPFQNGFVKGRSISDSVFLASEVMSFIHKARKTKTAWCAFKLDIHKAYDKLSWNFLEAVLRCQHLNKDKSFLVFSPNTSSHVKRYIASELGVSVSTRIGRYLGTIVDNSRSEFSFDGGKSEF
ncbi:reverse transcriptase [Senna tora]|uniref:Reverse transcriptase n=1 Tax=Senna tora TaxID=362788 RepID=A0A834W9R2_9FABA|nr:reverse transcriptase [Senna tora]